MSVAGKNFVIVGGSSGIGLGIVKRLIDSGATVYCLSRSASPEWPASVHYQTYDVLTNGEACLEGFLPDTLSGIVYAVGSIDLRPFQRFTIEDFKLDHHLNVIGAIAVIQKVLPALKAAGEGSIVLISSVAAKVGMNFHSSVSAAKGAINGLTLALAAEFAPLKIRVNAVAPSLTDTPLASRLLSDEKKRDSAAQRHPIKRVGSVDDQAAAICFLLGSDSSWITGQIIGVDGGLGTLLKS
ncbi:MAG: SDR family NAD(P)-dependent oxidoreductase [Mucilaginibacter sp.]